MQNIYEGDKSERNQLRRTLLTIGFFIEKKKIVLAVGFVETKKIEQTLVAKKKNAN